MKLLALPALALWLSACAPPRATRSESEVLFKCE